MTEVDWIFVIVLVASLLLGAWRGLVYEVISLLSWAASFLLAQWFAPSVAEWLPLQGSAAAVRYWVAFALVLVAALFAGGLIAFVVKKMISAVGLRPIDRVLGAGFGALRGVLILLFISVVVGMTPVRDSPAWKEATGPVWAKSVMAGLKPVLPEEFAKYLP